jgi:hypothetical protein
MCVTLSIDNSTRHSHGCPLPVSCWQGEESLVTGHRSLNWILGPPSLEPNVHILTVITLVAVSHRDIGCKALYHKFGFNGSLK